MKIYQAVQKLLVGDRQTDYLINILSFLESRLKMSVIFNFPAALISAAVQTAWVLVSHLIRISVMEGFRFKTSKNG
jgi:hypothetical protein